MLGVPLLAFAVYQTRRASATEQSHQNLSGAYLRGALDASGSASRLQGENRFHVRLISARGLQPASFELWVEHTNGGQLKVRREDRGEGFAKRIGLVKKVQTGDHDFDSRYFIDTAEPQFRQRYLRDPERRETMGQLLNGSYDCVALEAERVVAGLSAAGRVKPNPEVLPARQAVEHLHALSLNQPSIAPHAGLEQRRAWHLKLVAIDTTVVLTAGGMQARIETRSGKLQFEWLASVSLATQDKPNSTVPAELPHFGD